MKKVQRILMALAICLVSIVAVGCSSKDNNNNNNNNNNNSNNNQKKENVISAEELYNKVLEASKNVKSSKVKVQSKVTSDIFGKGATSNSEIEATISSEPLIVKLDGKTTIVGQKSSEYGMYFTKEEMYFLSSLDKKWYKVKEGNFKKIFGQQKNVGNLDAIPEFIKALGDNLTIVEEGSNYVVTYSGKNETAKQALTKSILSTQPTLAKSFENMTVENYEVKYVIDKKTFYPVESETKIKATVKKEQGSVSFDSETKFTYSDINKVESLKIPDEVKNAKEMK